MSSSTPRSLIEKDVSFLGVWKAQRINDNLMKQIASIAKSKKGYRSKLQVLQDTVNLYVHNDNGFSGNYDLITIHNLFDVTLNSFNHACIMCIKSDSQNKLEVFACRCNSDTDSKQIVHAYSEYKMTKAGIGYNQDIRNPDGTAWSLQKPRQKVVKNGNVVLVERHANNIVRNGDDRSPTTPTPPVTNGFTTIMVHNSSVGDDTPIDIPIKRRPISEREQGDFHGKTVYHTAAQTDDLDPYDDNESTMSAASSKIFKDELLQLSRELKEIKFLLERSTGISAEEFFQKEKDETYRKIYLPEPVHQETANHLSYADIRSYGVQTEGRNSKYIKRKHHPHARSKSRERVSKWTVSKPIHSVYAGHNKNFERNTPTTRSLTMPGRYRLPSDNSDYRL